MGTRKNDKPSDLFAGKLRDLREARGWSQRDFADELKRLGAPMDRAIIARIETGEGRKISLDEAILFAAALRSSLENMIVPSDMFDRPGAPRTIKIASKLTPPARDVRNWLKGMQPLRPEDRGAWLKAMPDNDLKAATDFDVFALEGMVRNLIDYLGVGNLPQARERVEAIRPLLDEIERKIGEEES
jgi:transcriptional regulator with XRE-family HTH domain